MGTNSRKCMSMYVNTVCLSLQYTVWAGLIWMIIIHCLLPPWLMAFKKAPSPICMKRINISCHIYKDETKHIPSSSLHSSSSSFSSCMQQPSSNPAFSVEKQGYNSKTQKIILQFETAALSDLGLLHLCTCLASNLLWPWLTVTDPQPEWWSTVSTH